MDPEINWSYSLYK